MTRPQRPATPAAILSAGSAGNREPTTGQTVGDALVRLKASTYALLLLVFLAACCTTASASTEKVQVQSSCALVSRDPLVYRCEFRGALCFLGPLGSYGIQDISCVPVSAGP